MYYFIGIVKQGDVCSGNIVPAYVLYWHHGQCQQRTRWRVMYYKTNVISMTKVMVTDPQNSKSLVDYLSAYRTYGHVAGSKKRLKYFPKGALFWFECDQYGRRTGPAIYVKHIPDKTVGMHVPDSGMNRIKDKTYSPSSIQQSVCFDRTLTPLSKAKKYIFKEEERNTQNE